MNRFWKITRILLALLLILLAAVFLGGKKEMQFVAEETAPAVQTAAPVRETTEAVQITQTEASEPVKTEYTSVPRYYQTDYPYIKFGNGTIATSGCSITCLAMVATYLTDQEYTPAQMAYHFGSYGKNNIKRLEYGNEMLQLPCLARDADWRETVNALKEGKVAIAMVDERSYFTNQQHFLVLAGLTEDGKFIVNDPMGTNYDEEKLKRGFEEGFEEYLVVAGFEGAWIYDKSAMPEDFVPYDAGKPVQEENRYDGYDLTDEDNYNLACFAWAVARKEPEEVQQAVLEVVLNRITAEGFPNTVKGVITQSDLRSMAPNIDKAAPDFPQYRAVTAAMYGPYVLPKEVLYFSKWDNSGDAWGELGSITFLYSR